MRGRPSGPAARRAGAAPRAPEGCAVGRLARRTARAAARQKRRGVAAQFQHSVHLKERCRVPVSPAETVVEDGHLAQPGGRNRSLSNAGGSWMALCQLHWPALLSDPVTLRLCWQGNRLGGDAGVGGGRSLLPLPVSSPRRLRGCVPRCLYVFQAKAVSVGTPVPVQRS